MSRLDPAKFSQQISNTYQQSLASMDPALAKAATVHAAATVASEQGWARSADAARLATTSVETLTKKLERGVPFQQARSETAAAMYQRFDDCGREKSREHQNDLAL
jgi:hypothetical protein